MRNLLFPIFALIIIGVVGVFLFSARGGKQQPAPTKLQPKLKTNMQIASPAFQNNQSVPEKYTCDGDNVSPPLVFSEVPKEAKALVLINDDPDAPAGTWVHWTLWNIPLQTEKIEENSVPQEATEGVTSFGKPGYGGPCPPSGTHRYFFKLYALDTTLDLDSSSDVKKLEAALQGHVLQQAELVGLYSRK